MSQNRSETDNNNGKSSDNTAVAMAQAVRQPGGRPHRAAKTGKGCREQERESAGHWAGPGGLQEEGTLGHCQALGWAFQSSGCYIPSHR